MASKNYSMSLDTEYTLKAVLNGSTLTLYVNDNQELTVNDSSRSTGKIGLITGTSSTQFEYVNVTSP